MPAVLVGVGGIGGEIVSQVRYQIDARVESSTNPIAAKEMSEQFRYLLVDTRHEPFHGHFQPGDYYVIPKGLDRFQTNERVHAFVDASRKHKSENAGPGTFAEWWVKAPDDGAGYYPPGDFASGAGQVRAKGKLAYHIDLTSNGPRIVQAVLEQVNELQAAQNELLGNQDRKIYIYLVCSLGGGTGSGISLILAQHLRSILPPQCALIGVFLLSSITTLAAGEDSRRSVEANTAAALAEIDYWQTPKTKTTLAEDRLDPFSDWGGRGNTIQGVTEPFELIYLYTFGNRDDRNLGRARNYYQYVAECLSTELYSDLDSLVAGQHSNFIQMFDGILMGDRTGRYASSGLASVRVPVDRIVAHLSRRYGTRLLREHVLVSNDESETVAREAVEELFEDAGIWWTRNNALAKNLAKPLANGDKLARQPNLATDEFNNSRRDEALSMIKSAPTAHARWRDNELKRHVDKRHQELSNSISDQTMAMLVKLMNRAEGDGYSAAQYALADARDRVNLEIAELRLLIDGDAEDGGKRPGLTKIVGRRQLEVANRQSATSNPKSKDKDPDLMKLMKGFGRFFNRDGSKAKTVFLKSWWDGYATNETQLIVATEARQFLSEYGQLLAQFSQYLQHLGTEMTAVADEFQRIADADLGKKSPGKGVLDVSVLDDVELVDTLFADDLNTLIESNTAQSIKTIIDSEYGLIASMKQAARDQPISAVQRQFGLQLQRDLLKAGEQGMEEKVDNISVWQALLLEMELRERLNRVDATLERARISVEEHRKRMEESGIAMEPKELRALMLEKFAASKLRIAHENAEPLWLLNRVKLGVHNKSRANITVLAFDFRAYRSFCHLHNNFESLQVGVESDLRINSSHAEGKHSIAIYRREGRVPLHYLSDFELKQMKDSFDYMSEEKPLYTDQRYVELATLAPPDPSA